MSKPVDSYSTDNASFTLPRCEEVMLLLAGNRVLCAQATNMSESLWSYQLGFVQHRLSDFQVVNLDRVAQWWVLPNMSFWGISVSSLEVPLHTKLEAMHVHTCTSTIPLALTG